MEQDAEKIFTDLKDDISTYAGLKLRLLKLMAIERAAGIMAALSHGLILMLFGFFTILFLFIALGFYLGELLDSVALGFLIICGIYLILSLCFIWAKGNIRVKLTNVIIDAFQTNDDDDDDDYNNENQSTYATRPVDTGEEGNPAAVPGVGSEN